MLLGLKFTKSIVGIVFAFVIGLFLQAFLRACGANDFLTELELDFSHNLLRVAGADAIEKGLRGKVEKIRAMTLFNCGLSEDGLSIITRVRIRVLCHVIFLLFFVVVCFPFFDCLSRSCHTHSHMCTYTQVFEGSSALHILDVGANIAKTRGGKNMQGFLTSLSMFVTKHPALHTLRLGGQLEGKLYMGKYIGPFLTVFSSTRTIQVSFVFLECVNFHCLCCSSVGFVCRLSLFSPSELSLTLQLRFAFPYSGAGCCVESDGRRGDGGAV